MPAQRLSMRQVREVLRLKWACGLSDRKIAQSLRVSRPTIAEYVRRAQAAGLSWPLPDALDERAPLLGLVLPDQLGVGGDIHTGDLVLGDEALHPLDAGPELIERHAGGRVSFIQ